MENQKETIENGRKKISKKIIYIAIATVVVIICSSSKIIYSSWCHESTDDAQIDGNIIPLRTTVTGYIKEIRFSDNQNVKEGDTLVVFDTVDLLAQVKQAEAQLLAAQAELQSNRKQVSVSTFNEVAALFNSGSAKENIEVAKAREWQSKSEYQRIVKMYSQDAATEQTLDNAKASFEVAKAQLAAADKQFNASNAEQSTLHSQTDMHSIQIKQAIAHIKQAESQLILARDQYCHAFVTAPCNGIVSKKNVEVGQFTPSGTALASVINLSNLWVTANFKETQLNDIAKGQDVDICVDAYPGMKIRGKVESLCGATGTKFSILPAENATGNFIKVTQRIPIRICIVQAKGGKPLLPGMNAVVEVKTK